MKSVRVPRLMLAGIGGDCGKTLVALGLAALWRREEMSSTFRFLFNRTQCMVP